MASANQLPCDLSGVCMLCKVTPTTEEETLSCITCDTPWHVPCLSSKSLVSSGGEWKCPDCSGDVDPTPVSGIETSSLVAAIRAIEADESLTEGEKAKKRQRLVSKGGKDDGVEEDDDDGDDGDDDHKTIRKKFGCAVCHQVLERPVSTSCGHNFCLKCFEKWIRQGKNTCATCRTPIPKKMARNPRINLAVVSAIRLATLPNCVSHQSTAKVIPVIRNEDRPDEAFTTERAKKKGNANACIGKIFVTTPSDHFGPIPAEHDPTRNQGLLVGESWKDRQACCQWGAHNIHMGGIAGQSAYGAQSVALSGGYADDEDHGEWFLYTGSGGRDLSGNKRTSKKQSFDQTFTNANEALRLSCKMGYPVRVVRSDKKKRSAYAPEEPAVRYDGIYRVEKCWRKVGIEGVFLVCRYLFVRCDNSPAPWNTSVEHGDRPRPLPDVPELENATELFVRTESPAWDFDEAEGVWKWMKPPPASRKSANNPERKRTIRKAKSIRSQVLKGFSCQICHKVMNLPVTTPCAHNFCKACLEGKFAGITQMRERSRGGRTLRAKKNVMTCPCCPTDLSEFLQNPQVNREVMDVIEELKKKEEEDLASKEENEENSENIPESSSGGNVDFEEEQGQKEEAEQGQKEEAEQEEGEETKIVESEGEEPASKRMKLDTDTAPAAPIATV